MTDPAGLVPHYRAINRELRDRGAQLTRALKQAAGPGAAARPGRDILALAGAFDHTARAVRCSIRLDLALDQARPGELDPPLLDRIVAAIRRELDAAAALLSPPPGPGAVILPFRRPPGRAKT